MEGNFGRETLVNLPNSNQPNFMPQIDLKCNRNLTANQLGIECSWLDKPSRFMDEPCAAAIGAGYIPPARSSVHSHAPLCMQLAMHYRVRLTFHLDSHLAIPFYTYIMFIVLNLSTILSQSRSFVHAFSARNNFC